MLGPLVGEPVPLDGGITNRNYKARFGEKDYVVRLPGKDTNLLEIDRYAELAASQLAAEAGVAPRVAAMLEDPPCLVSEFLGGRTMDGRRAAKARVPRGRGRRPPRHPRHRARACRAGSPPFASWRPTPRPPPSAARRSPTPTRRRSSSARLIEEALSDHGEHLPVPCHNDLLAANFLHDGERLWIVDWEYAGMGDRYFDLGNFAVNNELSADDEFALLTAYFDERPTPAGWPRSA